MTRTPLDSIREKERPQRQWIAEANAILKSRGVDYTATSEDIVFTANSVIGLSGATMSSAIVKHTWPHMPDSRLYHYTSSQALASIVKERGLRLYWLERRHQDEEVVHFCKAHNLDYLLEVENGRPRYRTEVTEQTFYSSFTTTQLDADDEQHFWRTFSGPDGGRLELRITLEAPLVRPVRYESYDDLKADPVPVIRDLQELSTALLQKKFVMQGFTRVSAFCLPSRFAREYERRLALSRTICGPLDVRTDEDGHKYTFVPFQKDTELGIRIELLTVQTNEPVAGLDEITRVFPRGD